MNTNSNDTANVTPLPQSTPLPAFGFLIDPIARTVTTVKMDDGDYRAIARWLGCAMFDIVRLSPPNHSGVRVDLYIDDEGRLTYHNPLGYFRLRSLDGSLSDFFCGRGLIFGSDLNTGETVTAPVRRQQVLEKIIWCDTPAQSEVEPGFTILTGEDAIRAMGLADD